MNCKRAKLHIALLIGDDLEDAAQAELHEHLRECAPCREYHEGMIAVPSPFEDLEERTALPQHDSLWPGLLDRLPSQPGLRLHDFNGWWAALAVAVACFAIALFWNDEARSGRWSSPVAVQDVSPNPSATLDVTKDIPSVAVGDGIHRKPSAPQQRLNKFFFHSHRVSKSLLLGIDPYGRPVFAAPLRGSSPSDFDNRDDFKYQDDLRP